MSESWLHSSYGTKIHQAVYWRDQGGYDIAVVSEDHWRKYLDAAPTNLAPPPPMPPKKPSDAAIHAMLERGEITLAEAQERLGKPFSIAYEFKFDPSTMTPTLIDLGRSPQHTAAKARGAPAVPSDVPPVPNRRNRLPLWAWSILIFVFGFLLVWSNRNDAPRDSGAREIMQTVGSVN